VAYLKLIFRLSAGESEETSGNASLGSQLGGLQAGDI
jgi:hypothetical protein